MWIGANELEIEEIHPVLGLKTNVFYYILPGEPFGGLVRRVTIQNLAESLLPLELLDGLPAVIPYGVNNFLLKELGRTVEAWMEVFNLRSACPSTACAPRSSIGSRWRPSRPGISRWVWLENELLPALVDPALVFENDTSLAQPLGFQRQSLETCWPAPGDLRAHALRLFRPPGRAGPAGNADPLQPVRPRRRAGGAAPPPAAHHPPGLFRGTKPARRWTWPDKLTAVVDTHTADPLFDAYCRQSFLDNVLRGGWPVLLGSPDQPHVYPIYSRKHGDLERDYNAFLIARRTLFAGRGQLPRRQPEPARYRAPRPGQSAISISAPSSA